MRDKKINKYKSQQDIIFTIKNKDKNYGNKFKKIEKHRQWLKKNKEKLIQQHKRDDDMQQNNFNIKAKKSLGQNFLHDLSIVENICNNVDIEGQNIIEIGPGTGFLTNEILKHNPKKLFLIEKDTRLIDNLNKIFQNEIKQEQIKIENIDALKLNLHEFFTNVKNEKITIISNLPYNVGTTLVIDWLKQLDVIDDIVVMLQKEVVDRIIAEKNTKDYGRISVLAQILCDCKKLFDVSPKCFHPQPKVMSSVIKITPKQNLIDRSIYDAIDNFCKIIFSQRRKKISNVIKSLNFDKLKVPEEFLSKRAEELSSDDILQCVK